MADNNDGSEEAPTAPFLVWIGLIVLSALSFWAQATVTEERFVPALNVIATRFKIPDDVAGATLMATGASAPELLTSFVALFITHSSLGLGTIIGSEIFNHLIICAGSVFAARTGQLQLDRAILLREVSFYALALVLLLVAFSDSRMVENDDTPHIFISFGDSAMLVAGYVAYVLVCSYYQRILQHFHVDNQCGEEKTMSLVSNGAEADEQSLQQQNVPVVVVPGLPFLRQISREPATNFDHHDDGIVVEELIHGSLSQISSKSQGSNIVYESDDSSKSLNKLESSTDVLELPTINSPASCYFLIEPSTPKPSKIHGLEEIFQAFNNDVSCFLWEQSSFYSKARIAINGWQLRWFTFSAAKVTSVPDRSYQTKMVMYPPFRRIDVDEAHLTMRLYPMEGNSSQTCVIMAPTSDILLTAVNEFRRIAKETAQAQQNNLDNEPSIGSFVDAEKGISLIAFPKGASVSRQFLHILLLPIKFLIHYTVPDTRNVDTSPPRLMHDAAIAITSCICWLIVGSYIMVTSLEMLGALMHVPNSVIGITVSAAGTSLPNYVASQVAARQGLGNMAVSNVFGSNIFNIFVGLGLPWFLYTGLVLKGQQPYGELQDDGISESVYILGGVLLLFVVLLFLSGFVLYKWHGYLFIALYVLYLAYAIGQAYI